jgi:hypothetical protein
MPSRIEDYALIGDCYTAMNLSPAVGPSQQRPAT